MANPPDFAMDTWLKGWAMGAGTIAVVLLILWHLVPAEQALQAALVVAVTITVFSGLLGYALVRA